MSLSILKIVAGILAAWFLKVVLPKFVAIQLASSSLKVSPGGSILWQHPFQTLLFLTGPYFPPKGWMGHMFANFSLYAKYGSTCLSSITFWNAIPIFWLSDAAAIRMVQTSSQVFLKDVEAYETMNIYGPHIISTEGADWKRHRSVANSAFNVANIALVWEETLRVAFEWFSEIDERIGANQETTVNLLNDLTQVTLLVISRAGFGRHASWKDDSKAESLHGHNRTFKDALLSTLRLMVTKFLIPTWIHRLSGVLYLPVITPVLAEARDSFDALRMHMLDVIGLARDWIAGGKTTQMDAALLRNLVEANMSQTEDGRHLTDDELLSNTFAFLLAGHETSAHTLSFAAILLALHPDVQARAYEEACRLWPNGVPSNSQSSYKDSFAQLEYILAIFHETLRLFPSAPRLSKTVSVDTVLTAHRFLSTADGKVHDIEKFEVPIGAGSVILIDTLALHRNPIYWGYDAEEFKPERFIDTDTYKWPREAFNAFAGGPRACIGQRFALTEGICLLAQLVRKYEILVPNELRGLPPAQQKTIMLKWIPGFTMTPANPKVVLRLRGQHPVS